MGNSFVMPNIVLIADRLYKSSHEIELDGDCLEQISDEYFNFVFEGLNKIVSVVTHYDSLEIFIDNIYKHKSDLVFTIFGGNASRNRMALVPGICESYKIKFVGADVYSRIISQDKQISKEIAMRFNINTPKYCLIEDINDIDNIEISLDTPVVVKPNLEGSSIGIDESSLCENFKDAKNKARELYIKLKQPILIEEFVPGKEVIIPMIGSLNEIKLFEVVEIFNPNQEGYFDDKLLTAKEKHHLNNTKHRIITEELSSMDIDNIKKMFVSLGKLDFARFDGRIFNGKFHYIEQTPDAYIGNNCSFVDIYKNKGKEYETLLKDIVNTALNHYHTLNPNY